MTGRGAGRGRGGGGRGGGSAGRGGFSRSLNHDQLTALGVNPAELTLGPVSQPPPLFPMLERRPMPLEVTKILDRSPKTFLISNCLNIIFGSIFL